MRFLRALLTYENGSHLHGAVVILHINDRPSIGLKPVRVRDLEGLQNIINVDEWRLM